MTREILRAVRSLILLPFASRAAWFVTPTLLLLIVVTPQPVLAITINMTYSDEGSTPPHPENPSWDPVGTILKDHFNAAKAIWESLLPGPGNYFFNFEWDDDIGATTLGLTSGIAPLELIEINPLQSWYADPTPGNSNEFNAPFQRLYSQLSASDQSTYFPGTAPPGGLEVNYLTTGIANGTLVDGAPANTLSLSGQVLPGTATPVDASNGFDLLSTIVHEIGHVLGIAGVEPGEYNIDPQHVGGLTNVLVLEDDDSPHLAGGPVPPGSTNFVPGFLMTESAAVQGFRRNPTATDILVIAEDQGITDVFLPRVGRITSGDWNVPSAWIGADVPSHFQDVYITAGNVVTLSSNAYAKDLLVSAGNSLQVNSFLLTATGTLTFDTGSLSVGAGGTISTDHMVRFGNDISTTAGSTVQFNDYSGGLTNSASFNGNVNVGYGDLTLPSVTFQPNKATNPTKIANWNIAQQLAIDGGTRFVTLIIDNGAAFVSGSGRIGSNAAVASTATVTISGATSSWVVNGPLDIPRGNLNLTNFGMVTAQSATVGSNFGQSIVDVNNGTMQINGNLDVGPPTTSGGGKGSITIHSSSSVNVAGNVDIHGTSILTSEISVQGGNLNVTGIVKVGPHGTLIYGSGSEAVLSSQGAREIENLGGMNDSSTGGVTRFTSNSVASDTFVPPPGHIVNHPGGTTFAAGGVTEFRNSSNAGNARIDNKRSFVSLYAGETRFYDTASAGSGQFFNEAGHPSVYASVIFNGNSTGGNGTFVNLPGVLGQSLGGVFVFNDQSNAGTGTYTSQGEGGIVVFNDNASADHGTFTTADNIGGNSRIQFFENSTAANANFSMGYSTPLQFYEHSTAADADITVRQGGYVLFSGSFTADYSATTTAAGADIILEGGSVFAARGGNAGFSTWSTAGDATIVAHGGTVFGAGGATIEFDYTAHAGSATLVAHGGTNGGQGAQIYFRRGATGDNSRVTINAGSLLDVSGNISYGTTIPFVEGAGNIHLGGSTLTIGSAGIDSTISGVIYDGNNPNSQLVKVGAGKLSLDGANTYTGATTVSAGTLAINGSVAGNVVVNAGATLAGSGTIMGTTTVADGGILAPGNSPGTLRAGSLTLNPNSVLNMELGVVSDLLIVTGNLTLDGVLNILPGTGFDAFGREIFTYSGMLTNNGLTIGSVPNGFSPGDFTIDFSTPGEINLLGPATTVPGDYNFNGVVDAADYVLWRKHNGTAATLPNDSTPGAVTTADYDVWRAHFGQTAGSSAGASVDEFLRSSDSAASVTANLRSERAPYEAFVPEPGSLVLILLAVALVPGRLRMTSPPSNYSPDH